MEPVTLTIVSFIGVLAAAAGASVLIGAAVGYYSASTDLRRERARAWNLGYSEGASGGAPRNPYEARTLAPAPPLTRHTIPAAVAADVFDQDA